MGKMGAVTVVCTNCGYQAATSKPKNALKDKPCPMFRCNGTMKDMEQ